MKATPQTTTPDPGELGQQLRRIVEDPGFFRLIFDAIPLQIAVKSTRPESFGRFLLWNRQAEEWTGIRAEEVIGRTDYDFFPREQADFFLAKDREVAASGQTLVVEEERILSRIHGECWLRTVKTPILDESGEPLALLAASENITERKRTATELQETIERLNEERNLYGALLDNLPLSTFAKSVRPETMGQFILWNRTMETLRGLAAEEVLGRTAVDVYGPKFAQIVEQQDQQILKTGEVLEIPLESIRAADGESRLVHMIKAPVFDDRGTAVAIVGVLEDITDRIRMEAERSQAVEMIRQLNSRVPGAIFQLKVSPDGERRFTYISERVEEIYGVPAEEFLRDPGLAENFVLPRDRERLSESGQFFAGSEGGSFEAEFRIRRRDGEIRWLQTNATGEPRDDGTYWHGFTMDVTDRKEAQEAMRESEERWQLALGGTEAGVWDWNIRTMEFFFSDRWREMFGYGRDELPETTRDLLELIHPEDRAAVRQATLDHLRRRSEIFRCEYRMRRKDGSHIWIIAHAKAHFDERGRAKRMIGTLIDISDRKRVEEQLVHARDAAERANRAKSDFLAMMSHEIRTPLNGVIGFAELLADTDLDERQREYAQTVCESGANLLHVLDDILDYSKIESGKLDMESSPVNMRELATSAVETFRARAEAKGLYLSVRVDPDVPELLLADPVRLRQVLANLVSNAVKFTSEGSVAVVLAGRVAPAEQDLFPLCISVSDTGPGIAEEDVPLLFSPFQQLDVSMARRFGGTGLGLAIVRRLLDLMNGTIRVSSTRGKGVTFDIELSLPVVNRVRDARSAGAGDHRRLAETKPLEILLVEDNGVNRRLARLMLERMGYAPDEAVDGPDAIRCATAKTYDLILMDIQMPGMDGYEAAREILAQTGRRLPLIAALTAHAMQTDRERSAAHGMFRHVTKPLRMDDLRVVIEAAHEELRNRMHPPGS